MSTKTRYLEKTANTLRKARENVRSAINVSIYTLFLMGVGAMLVHHRETVEDLVGMVGTISTFFR